MNTLLVTLTFHSTVSVILRLHPGICHCHAAAQSRSECLPEPWGLWECVSKVSEAKSQHKLRGYAPEDVGVGKYHRVNGEWQLLFVFLQNGLRGKTVEVDTDLGEREQGNTRLPHAGTAAL